MPSDGTAQARGLELLDAVESRWREALGELERDRPEAAASAVEAASTQLRELESIQAGHPAAELALVQQRIRSLQGLHSRLVERTAAAQERTAQQLAEAGRGRRAVGAYAVAVEPSSPRWA